MTDPNGAEPQFPRSARPRARMPDPSGPAPAPAPPGSPGEVEAGLRALFAGPLRASPALLLVARGDAHRSGWGPQAAIELATVAADHAATVALVDLALAAPVLHARVGVDNDEGITEVVLFGVSLVRASRAVAGRRFVLLPAGTGAPDPAEVLASARWDRILADAGRRDALLLLYAPEDAAGLGELAARVGRAVVLAGAGEDEAHWSAPAGGCEVVAVLSPAPEPAFPAAAPRRPAPAAVVGGEPVAGAETSEAAEGPQVIGEDEGSGFPASAPAFEAAEAEEVAETDDWDVTDALDVYEEPVAEVEDWEVADALLVHEEPAGWEVADALEVHEDWEVADTLEVHEDWEVAEALAVYEEPVAETEDWETPEALEVYEEPVAEGDDWEVAEALRVYEEPAAEPVAVETEEWEVADALAVHAPAPAPAAEAGSGAEDEAAGEPIPIAQDADAAWLADLEAATAEFEQPEPVAQAAEPEPWAAEPPPEQAVPQAQAERRDPPDEPPPPAEGASGDLSLDEWLVAAGLADAAPPAAAAREPEPEPAFAPEPAAEARPEPAPEPRPEPVAAAPEPEEPEPEPEPVPDDEEDEAADGVEAAVPGGGSPRYLVPRPSGWRERLVRWLAVLTLCVWTYYIAWRWAYTLNPEALWFSIPLVLAETWGLLATFVMVHSVWRLKHRAPLPTPEGLSVDVFVTCYDEPLEVIRRTAVGARAIRYPHQTYVLDDGKRAEVRAMAEELGIGYLRREGNEHAKAGNLNYALRHTTGDFVLQLDADHVPLPHILDRMLGFFAADPKLAFVQSPQDFYNIDAFTYEVDETARRIWEEQRLFFTVLQPGKDRLNAAFFCGSCAVLRRAALDEIGGFSTHSVTEDIETSIRLHARGWNSAFYGESLAYGLAAGSATAFHTQHLRWGQGAMQVLRRFNPLTLPGLSLNQRIAYFGSLTAYVGGVQKLVFLLAPVVFFLTGKLPMRALDADFAVRFVPVLVLSILLALAISRGTGNVWISERYHVAKFWTYTRAVTGLFRDRPLRFHVTPKGPAHVPFRAYAPQVVLIVVMALAAAWSLVAMARGWVDYGEGGWKSPGFVVNVLWASLNFGLAASVVELSFRVRQQRADHRFRDRFPIRVRAQGGAGEPLVALTEDLNPLGIAFRTGRRLQAGTEVRVTLPLATGKVRVGGRVVHSERVDATEPAMFRSGVVFDAVPMDVRDAIELHCTHHAVPLEQSRYRPALRRIAGTTRRLRNARREPRQTVQLPAQVWAGPTPHAGEDGGHAAMAFLEELSPSGARLVMDVPLVPGTPIRFHVPGTSLEREGRVVFSRAIETPIGVRYAVGVRQAGAAAARPGQPWTWLVHHVVRTPLRFLTNGA